MVRFKNRYLVMEMVWKDGRIDEAVSECIPADSAAVPSLQSAVNVRGLCRQRHTLVTDQCPALSVPPPAAAEAVLLGAVRDSVQQNFGDYGLGCALASFQGEGEDGVRRTGCLPAPAAAGGAHPARPARSPRPLPRPHPPRPSLPQ